MLYIAIKLSKQSAIALSKTKAIAILNQQDDGVAEGTAFSKRGEA
jgi:hypothetical protein